MDYKKIYDAIIEKAKKENKSGYLEKHHIIPKCIGGSNEESNIVKLTLKQHYICHKLLLEIYPNEKSLKYAMFMICSSTLEAEKRFIENNFEIKKDESGFKNPRLTFFIENKDKIRISAKEYEYFKELDRKARTGRKYTDEQKLNVSIGTKIAMRSKNAIASRGTGSRNSKHYYNKETGEAHKWFPGDPDIDLSIYAWGRKKMSDEQKMKISKNYKNIRKCIYNRDIQTKYVIDKKFLNNIPDGWIIGLNNNIEKFRKLKEFIYPLFNKTHFKLINENVFLDEIIYKGNVISLGALEVSKNFLKENINKSIDDSLVEAFSEFIKLHISEIEKMNLKIYTE